MIRRRADEVIWRSVQGRVVALDLRSSRYFSLNQSATILWDLLEHDVSADELAEALAREYGLTRQAAERDVAVFLEELSSNNLLEE